MALLLVAGGTGAAGRATAREALGRGWQVRSLSRTLPAPTRVLDGVEYVRADVASGSGLAAALDGVEVVIDTLEARRGRALRGYPLAGRRLLDAARGSGVDRAVSVSIMACDQFPLRYYRSKVAKEQVYAAHALPTTVVRCGQFHDLLGSLFERGERFGFLPILPQARLQPIDLSDVARALVDAAEAPAGGFFLTAACGPEVRSMRSLAGAWRTATGSTARVVDLPVPGRAARVLAEGRNLMADAAFGTVTFEQWLARRAVARADPRG
ncbi:SDR family oxidoreductase [Sinomonas atrocyanea]|uniref:SDR family oxidoreductase n=1 Tax=Sinomonas atrocyanea TaxID=37927 RepID=UPI003D9876CE